MRIEFDNDSYAAASIKVVGIGGAGGNAVNRMINANLQGVDFITINTDKQALSINQAPTKIQIGENLTKGLGAGSDPEIGLRTAEESHDRIMEGLAGADMVFITAGMGGGTGTGAAPLIAEMAKQAGALTVGIVTKPFMFEGTKRMKVASDGIDKLKESLDTLIAIPNQRLLAIVEKNLPFTEAFKVADDILLQATRGISDIINVPGIVNVDFMDVRTIMREMGDAIMGTGTASGENRGAEAAELAINSPLLENVSIKGAQGVLININGGPDMTLYDIDQASTLIKEEAGKDANIIFGAVVNEKLQDEIHVTVIATGFNAAAARSADLGIGLNDSGNIVDFKENIDIQRLIREAAAEEDDDFVIDSYSSTGRNSRRADQKTLEVPTHVRRGVNLDEPTFLRRQAD